MSFVWPILCVVLLALTACSGERPQTVTVLAASSLTDAFAELAAAFEAEHPNVVVQLSFAGSAALAAQIVEGAPADLFASANELQMATVVDAGRAGDPRPFATNTLVIITPVGNPAGISGPADLARPGVRLLAAQPAVPIRLFTDEMLGKAATLYGADFPARVRANVISEEGNVRQLTTKILLGEADAGVVYRTDVSPAIVDQVHTIEIPAALNVTARYPLAVLNDAPAPTAAAALRDFVLSERGQAILAGWGFGPPGAGG